MKDKLIDNLITIFEMNPEETIKIGEQLNLGDFFNDFYNGGKK